jgi:hypothetical protein
MAKFVSDYIVGELKAGNLPAEFMEEHRIVDPLHPAALAVAGYNKKIVDRLLRGQGVDPETVSFSYLLINEEEPNAFMISIANPPIIGVSKGLLKLLEYEDELAGINRHELQHNNLAAYTNTKVQEWLADQSAPDALQNAGYNPDGLKVGLLKLRRDSGKNPYSYFDEHPDMDIRIRDLENSVVIKTRREGSLNDTWTPLDASIQAIAQTATTPPRYIERLLQARGYETLSSVEKCRALIDIFDEEIAQLDGYFASRLADFNEAISALVIDHKDSAQREVFNDLIDRFMIRPNYAEDSRLWSHYGEQCYQVAYTPAGGVTVSDGYSRQSLQPIGRLRELDESIQAFVQSKTSAEAETHALVINELAARYDLANSKYDNPVFGVALSNFNRPHYWDLDRLAAKDDKVTSIKVGWGQHVVWANEAVTSHIRHALQRLGLGSDTRLTPLSRPERDAIQVFGDKIRSDYQFNERGEIIGIGQDFDAPIDPKKNGLTRAQYMEYEIQRMARRDAFERQLIETVDWSELKEDFDHFLKTYKSHLTPANTVAIHGGDVFAREFINRMERLAAEDLNHFRKLYRFLTDRAHGHENTLYTFLGGSSSSGEIVHGLPKGVSPTHPYMELVLADKYAAFSMFQKSEIIGYTAFLKTVEKPNSEEEKFSISSSQIFGSFSSDMDSFIKLFNYSKNSMGGEAYTKAVFNYRLHFLLKQNDNKPLNPQHMQAILCIASDIKDANNGIDGGLLQLIRQQTDAQALADLHPQKTAQEIADIYALYIAGDQFAANASLRRRYEAAIMERANVITDRFEKERLAQSLLYVKEVPSLLVHQKDLGYSSSDPFIKNQYTGQLHSHDFREWATKLYVQCVKEELGLDDGSDAYFQRLKTKMDFANEETTLREMEVGGGQTISGSISNSSLSEILPLLADTVNAQPNTAFFMRDLWSNRNLATAITLGHLGGGVELSIDLLAEDPVIRHETIDFLTTPLDEKAALAFGKIVNEVAKSGGFRGNGDDLEGNKNWAPEKCVDIAKTIHQNFWRAPMVARGWYLDKILFPPGQSHDELAFKNAMQLIMDKTFPGTTTSKEYRAIAEKVRKKRVKRQKLEKELERYEERRAVEEKIDVLRQEKIDSEEEKQLRRLMKSRSRYYLLQDFKNNTHDVVDRISYRVEIYWRRLFAKNDEETQLIRQIAESYIEAVPVPEQRLLLTAIIAARDVSQQNTEKVRPGQFAAQVLTYLEEMGGKALQAINSFHDTPQHIKDDTKHAKSDYNKPKRWDAIAWCQEYGIQASSATEKIVYYGAVEAAGSMGYTMFNRTADGNLYADTLLRPHAAGRCEREADNMVKTARKLADKNPKFSAAVDIAETAKRHAFVETCMSLAAKQGEVARQLYNGLETYTVVNGQKYALKHQTADIIRYSDGGKRARVVPGVEFNKLPENTEEQRAYKKATAVQLWGIQILNRLSGLPCDCDPHGANQKINNGTVGHFDFGMAELAMPTMNQKRALARSVVRAYRDHILFHKSIGAALGQQIKKADVPEKDKHYLSSFMRHMLALGDFETYISDDEKKSIVGSIFASGKVDSVIMDEIRKELGPLSNTVINQLTRQAEKNPIFNFDDSHRVSHIVIPALTKVEQAVINGKATAKAKTTSAIASITDALEDRGPIRLLSKMSHALFAARAEPRQPFPI